MDIRQLKYFVAIIQNQNFTKAAQKLYISQPSLSRQISVLEDELGVRLLTRSNREVSLTPAGEVLYSHATAIINEYNKCIRSMENYKSCITGTLHLATLNAVETTFFPKFIQQFKGNHPYLKFEYTTGDFTKLLNLVQTGTVDIAITMLLSHQEYPNVNTVRTGIAEDRLVVVVSSNSAYANIDSFNNPDIKNLLRQPCFLFKGWHSYKSFFELLNQYSVNPTVKYYDDLPIFLLQTLNAFSYTVIPENHFNSIGGDKWYHKIPLPDEYGSLDLAIIYQKNSMNPYVDLFLKELENFN